MSEKNKYQKTIQEKLLKHKNKQIGFRCDEPLRINSTINVGRRNQFLSCISR